MPYKDPARQRAAERKWYAQNRQRAFDKKNRKRADLRELVRRAKERPCADCAVRYPFYVMDFDHVGGEKKMLVSKLVNFGSTSRLFAEMAKCDIVCANCHRERTWQRFQAGLSDAKPADPSQVDGELTLFDLP